MTGSSIKKDGALKKGIPPPPPTKSPGMEKYAPAYAFGLVLGLTLIAWGTWDYILITGRKDFSNWEPATCYLESVESITTHTSWDPVGLIDPERLGTHASWGLGVYAIVRVNVTENAAGATAKRIFRSGANDCGVVTYVDRCSCLNDTCWKTRNGNMSWEDCPADPWCDIAKAVPGPCLPDLGGQVAGCAAPQLRDGVKTGETVTACSNHTLEPERILKCWAAPDRQVPQWKGRIANDDRSLYNQRGKWLGVRFTPLDEPCELAYQYSDHILATLISGGVFSACGCCSLCACLVGILCEEDALDRDEKREKMKEKNKRKRKRKGCCRCCSKNGLASKKTSPLYSIEHEEQWWRTSPESTDEEWTTDEEGWTTEEGRTEDEEELSDSEQRRRGEKDDENEKKKRRSNKKKKKKKKKKKNKNKNREKKMKKTRSKDTEMPVERQVTFGSWYDHRLSQ
jgi:hypothetical protein